MSKDTLSVIANLVGAIATVFAAWAAWRGPRRKTMERMMTLGECASALDCPIWKLQRVYQRKLLPAPPKAGNIRLVPESGLPKLRAALQAAGYLKA